MSSTKKAQRKLAREAREENQAKRVMRSLVGVSILLVILGIIAFALLGNGA